MELTQKDSLMVEFFRFRVIFDISSDLGLILSNLRAVQSASQSVEKKLPNVQKEERGGGQRRFEQCSKNCRISKEVHP